MRSTKRSSTFLPRISEKERSGQGRVIDAFEYLIPSNRRLIYDSKGSGIQILGIKMSGSVFGIYTHSSMSVSSPARLLVSGPPYSLYSVLRPIHHLIFPTLSSPWLPVKFPTLSSLPCSSSVPILPVSDEQLSATLFLSPTSDRRFPSRPASVGVPPPPPPRPGLFHQSAGHTSQVTPVTRTPHRAPEVFVFGANRPAESPAPHSDVGCGFCDRGLGIVGEQGRSAGTQWGRSQN